MKVLPAVLALLVAGAVVALGLGSLASWTEEAPTWPRVVRAGERATVTSPGGEPIVLPAPPARILPANAALVDLVAALVGPERVCALPRETGDYSALGRSAGAWDALPRFAGFSAEALFAREPDLVLAHAWQKPEVVALLRQEGVPVLVVPLPRRWADVERTIELLGDVLDAAEAAAALRADLDARIAALRARTEATRGLAALSYTNLGSGGWAAGRDTTADVLFELAGLENAAARAGLVGHQALDQEALLRLDPDLIVVGASDAGAARDEFAPTAAYLYGEPSLARLRAVRERRLIALPPRLFTTTSHELLRSAEELVARLEDL